MRVTSYTKIGFFSDTNKPICMDAAESDKKDWLERLAKVQKIIRCKYNYDSNSKIKNLIKTGSYNRTKGIANCRFCGEPTSGYNFYTLRSYKWSDDIEHYVRYHNVQLDPNFKQFIDKTYDDLHTKTIPERRVPTQEAIYSSTLATAINVASDLNKLICTTNNTTYRVILKNIEENLKALTNTVKGLQKTNSIAEFEEEDTDEWEDHDD